MEADKHEKKRLKRWVWSGHGVVWFTSAVGRLDPNECGGGVSGNGSGATVVHEDTV